MNYPWRFHYFHLQGVNCSGSIHRMTFHTIRSPVIYGRGKDGALNQEVKGVNALFWFAATFLYPGAKAPGYGNSLVVRSPVRVTVRQAPCKQEMQSLIWDVRFQISDVVTTSYIVHRTSYIGHLSGL